MILIDANLLLYAKISDYPQHARSKAWLQQQLNANQPHAGLPWASLLAFVRIATHPKLFAQPLSVEQAWSQVEQWLALPGVWNPVPGARHGEILGTLLRQAGSGGNLVADAHLAALALEYDLIVYSADKDFARFPGLHWQNPLETTP